MTQPPVPDDRSELPMKSLPLLGEAGWLRALRQRTDAPPQSPRLPMGFMGSTVHIGSIDMQWAARLMAADLPLRATAHGYAVAATRGEPLDKALARIAEALREMGPAAGWRNELVAVTDLAGHVVARIERAATRALGIATHAVHLVGMSPAGGVWVQQRAFDKPTDPGLWDTTMGGTVVASETVRDTLARETHEEAGLSLADLVRVRAIGRLNIRRPVPEGYIVELIDMFEATLPEGVVPVNHDGEVAAFECLDIAALWQRLSDGVFTPEAAVILLHWLRLRSPPPAQGRRADSGKGP